MTLYRRAITCNPLAHFTHVIFLVVAPFQDHTDDLSFGLNYYAGKRHQHAMVLEDTVDQPKNRFSTLNNWI